LSDLFAGRQAVRHHAEGEQDRLDDDGDDQQGHGRTGSSLWQASSDAFLAATAFMQLDTHVVVRRGRSRAAAFAWLRQCRLCLMR
jgi:hypothetical protein